MQSSEQGFSLLELMYIVLILGILAATSVSLYKGFKQTTYETTVQQDIRNTALICESYYAESQVYPTFGPFTGTQSHSNFTIAPRHIIRISKGVTVQAVRLPDNTVNLIGTHPGTSQGFQYIRHLGF